MDKEKRSCSGFSTKGYWKGHPCGAVAKYQCTDGKWWCKNHLPLDKVKNNG